MKRIKDPLLRLGCMCIGLVVLIFGCDETSPTDSNPDWNNGGDVLLVARQEGDVGHIAMILLENGAVQTSAAVVGDNPTDILYHRGLIYVVNSSSDDVHVLELTDRNTLGVVDSIEIGADKRPHSAVIADNGYMYVTTMGEGEVTVVNLNSGQAEIDIRVGGSPSDIAAFGDKLYVCSGLEDLLFVISTRSNRVLDTIAVGMNPQRMALDDFGRLHVICSGNYADRLGEVFIINPLTDEVQNVFTLGGSPEDIAITADGYAYVTVATPAGEAGRLYRYDVSTFLILNGIRLNNPISVSEDARRVIASPDDALFIACTNGGRVDKVIGEVRDGGFNVGTNPLAMVYIER